MMIKKKTCLVLGLLALISNYTYALDLESGDTMLKNIPGEQGGTKAVLHELSKVTVYKLHLGMSVSDVLNVYPDSDIDLFGTGKDIGGKADKFHSKDKEEIKQLKFGVHGGAEKYRGTLYDSEDDRNFNLSFTYDGILSSLETKKRYGANLDCMSLFQKLSEKYGGAPRDKHGELLSAWAGSNDAVFRWSGGTTVMKTLSTDPETVSHYDLSVSLRGCIEGRSVMHFELASPYLDQAAQTGRYEARIKDVREKALQENSRGLEPAL